MHKQTKKQVWFMVAATMLSTLLGALIEQDVIPAPYKGMAVSIGMFLAAVTRGPAAAPED